MADTVNFEVRRGSNAPAMVLDLVKDTDGTPFPFAGREFVMNIRRRGKSILRMIAGVYPGFDRDDAASRLTWTPSIEDSRKVPLGRLLSYEIEWRDAGAQGFVAEGSITGLGGLNDDTTP